MALAWPFGQPEEIKVTEFGHQIILGDRALKFQEVIRDLIAQGYPEVRLDFGGVSYVDSAGVEVLTLCIAAAARAGTKLKFSKFPYRRCGWMSAIRLWVARARGFL